MAFFKLRKAGEEHTTPAPVPESVEAMRKRARHRLIGAALLVLIGVIGFPMLFDNQPRPIPVDLPIQIPDRNTVKPLGNLPVGNAAPATVGSQIIDETAEPQVAASQAAKVPAPLATPAQPVASNAASSASAAPTPAASRTATGSLGVAATAVAAKPVVKAAEKVVEKPADKPKLEPAAKTVAAKPEPVKTDNGLKAQSLLEGKEVFVPPAPAAATGARFVVQVGAFSDAAKAHEARVKLEAAGLKTYTQVVNPKDGKRIRVRVGPFETKAEADKTAAKVKKLDLPAAILEL